MPAPLVQQSSGRLKNLGSIIRKQQFLTKTELAPQTTQAITEGILEQERLEKQDQSRIAIQAKLERERITESSRQADLRAQEARRARKAAEPSFIQTLFGK